MKIYTFGDSWGAGWGLEDNEKNFTQYLETYLSCSAKNYSQSGSSLGQITHDFINKHHKLMPGDLVTVIVPPDVRWYTERNKKIYSLFLCNKKHRQFLKGKTDYWFLYHHALFMHSIYTVCLEKKANVIFAHNYGKLIIHEAFENLIPKKIFLDYNRSLADLLGSADWFGNYSLNHDGPPRPLVGENFIPNDTHPNEKGHEIIANLLYNKFNEKL